MKRKRMLCLLGLGGAAAAVVAVFYLLARQGVGIGCPVYMLTKLRCPGCGNSRAVLALLEGDLLRALKMNWLFPVEFGYLLWVLGCGSAAFLRTGRFSYRPRRWWPDALLLAVILIWGIVRNLIGI